jgi:hypothetical protein
LVNEDRNKMMLRGHKGDENNGISHVSEVRERKSQMDRENGEKVQKTFLKKWDNF